MDKLVEHYNKFNEDKRLDRRHGHVEFVTSFKYIEKYLNKYMQEHELRDYDQLQVLDVGAGTGKYSIKLAQLGCQVTSVEYVKYNLGRLKQNATKAQVDISAYQGDARKLKKCSDNTYDMTLIFGPMYHLYTDEDKVRALQEAKRVTKPGGYILVAYLMNEYSVIVYGFREGNVNECLKDGRLDSDYHTHSSQEELYEYVRLEDINRINDMAGVTRQQIISADGPADYMRRELNAMDDETYERFIEYHLKTCERPELLGAGAHTLDILQKVL
ncbi:MAG: class I SAM-dependent methyltransferase [Lachnospiraceae bacterium]|nr:class I SAM-dependent methyltransferase [Lachnospiraceae bacterium]